MSSSKPTGSGASSGRCSGRRFVKSDQDLYNELAFYTLAHRDPAFIHQNIVDAFAAQHADEASKPIYIVFALVGLYLHVEKSFTGKQVQLAHMELAKRRKQWVRPEFPEERGAVRIADVLAVAPGPARDMMIRRWCESAWDAWKDSRQQIADLVNSELKAARTKQFHRTD
ncbi:MAG: DUF5946 family protein [Terracidiphilus sp.]